jgi:energy-coupling factor transporter ATP-binding protein EcfA2
MGNVQVEALHESSLEVFEGEFLVVLGPQRIGQEHPAEPFGRHGHTDEGKHPL